MALPWIRLDSFIATHDKILDLLADPAPKADRFQAAASYMFALGWSGGNGTDGYIRDSALPFVHGSRPAALLLVKYRLWEPVPGGWRIPNFEQRQELAVIAEAKRAAQRAGARKGNCIRHHGPDCGCWREPPSEPLPIDLPTRLSRRLPSR